MKGSELFSEKPPVLIYDTNGELIGEYLVEFQSRITLNTCKNLVWLKHAAVSGEDREFYTHNGVSIRGVARATLNNILSFSAREGAGSITQQLGRNLFTSRNWPVVLRKIYETYIAFLIENKYSKDEILCLYLNKIYMGEGRFGAEDASYYYFRKPPELLTPAEAAMIVGIFPSPTRYSPLNDISSALKKQKMVMSSMVRDSYLTEKESKASLAAFNNYYRIINKAEIKDYGTIGLYGSNRYFKKNLAPDVNEYVRRYLTSQLGEEETVTPGLKIYTTIDLKKQLAATEAVRQQIVTIRSQTQKTATGFEKNTLRKIIDEYNGVFISLDSHSGDILAMIGGLKTEENQYSDRVFQMQRQPGSVIKGFLYALAFERGILNPESIVVDEPLNISGYKPENWYRNYKGDMSIQEAVALSVNTIAVKTLKDIGINYFLSKMKDAADIPPSRFKKNLSLALGSGELTPMELSRLYAVILNKGRRVNSRLIKKIEDSDGSLLENFPSIENEEQIIKQQTAKSILELLKSTADLEDGTARWIGDKVRTLEPGFSFAAKTGTVQTDSSVRNKFKGLKGSHDAWFVALVPGEVNVLWFGNDSGAPFEGSGSGTAGSAWLYYAENALNGHIEKDFPGTADETKSFFFFWKND